MLIRSQQMLLAGFWAVLGTCLGAMGCDTMMGPMGPGEMGATPAPAGPTYPGQPYSQPAKAQTSSYSPVVSGPISAVGGPTSMVVSTRSVAGSMHCTDLFL